jgi:hypothetical protein
MFYLDTSIDLLFFLDIMITFVSAYEVPGGLPEVRLKKIFNNYVYSWFFIDLVATIPTDLIEKIIMATDDSAQVVYLSRFARLPRLYKMTKIVRLVKIIKIGKFKSLIKKAFRTCNLSNGNARMLQSLTVAMFAVHIVGCFWFMAAKMDDFNPSTWVSRRGIINMSVRF